MFSNRGSSLISTVLAVAAAGGVGVAGYYLVSGGAGCGSCSTHAGTDVAAVTPVAAATDSKSDCGGCSADAMVVADAAKTDCATACSMGEAQVVAMEGESCATACSGDAMTVANEGESCSVEKACDAEVAACESSCEGKNEGEVMLVSGETEEAACESSCSGEAKAKVCPITGQPIADAGS
ncbi:MAG: hypothetical protein AAF937_08145 [Planctomycetota bacterium]